MRRFSKVVSLLFVLATLVSCAEGNPAPIDTTMLPVATEPRTEPQTEPQTEPETTVPETTVPETTVEETVIVQEYIVESGNVWTFEDIMPEPDEAVLVTTLVDFKTEPYTDPFGNTHETTLDENGNVVGNSPVHTPTAPIIPPSRDNYYTDGAYSPIVFMYHSVLDEPFTSLESLFLRPSEFEEHLMMINAMGYQYGFADEFTTTDQPTVMLTFDDGYTDNYTEVFPLLKKYNAKATIFMVAGAVNAPGYLTSEQIKEMADSGLVHFGSHTSSHSNLTTLSEDSLRYEFAVSKNFLEEVTGMPVNSVCYPGGRVSDEIARIAEEYYCFGYTTVVSANTAGCDPMLVPRVRISRGMNGYSILNYLIY